MEVEFKFAPKIIPTLCAPLGSYRYRVFRGGRGSGKSFQVALMAAIFGAETKRRILCAREFQNSVKDSFHAELKNAILSNEWLSSQYDVGVDYLRHKSNGTEFIFKGLRNNISSVKSMAQIDLCIVEEAETVPNRSWMDLLPTIRQEGSEIFIIYNPRSRDSWVASTFDSGTNPPRSAVIDINWRDNPWFPSVLNEQRLHDQENLDTALYNHIWEGAYYEKSDAQVFAGRYYTSDFDPQPDWDGPYFGLDFGFSQDPTAGVKMWINDNVLYIEHELYEKALELDHTPSKLKEKLPDVEKFAIYADSARPESISYLKRHGIPKIQACQKGKGSVEDGVEFIKSFRKVVIHPRCVGTIKEFELYSYKIDRLSGNILPILVDSFNHIIDSARYGLEPIMRRKKYNWGGFQ